tara:strand:+ start:366 stop:1841 length:1476 start_codon:yes stop_codon:yes gene_type:complete
VDIPFNNLFTTLPQRFFERVDPTPVSAPKLIKYNDRLAEELGLTQSESIDEKTAANLFGGNALANGASPLSMTYGGFQFGHWNPQLGDGRAILLGEVIDTHGDRRDIQLKGAGPTPFSRGGDGRAGIGPVLREYIVSEAMSVLGVPTTRSLAVVATGEKVYRESAEPGAVLTRVAKSHIRVGTFQHFAYKQDFDAVKILADHVIERHYPEAKENENPYLGLIISVLAAHAETVSKWQLYGFIHGVMNTDNCTISGETLDYGPCAFMDIYHPDKVFSSIDFHARYSYSGQPKIAQWNLAGFSSALLPLMKNDQDKWVEKINIAINDFPAQVNELYLEGMRKKLGLSSVQDGDEELARDLLGRMAQNRADFTQTFRLLSTVSGKNIVRDTAIRTTFQNPYHFDDWAVRWRSRLEKDGMKEDQRVALMCSVNPKFIARNHLVAEVIEAAEGDDYEPLYTLLDILEKPFEEQRVCARFSTPPRKDQVVHQTFCGT